MILKNWKGIGILVDEELVDQVVEVRHKIDHIMSINLIVDLEILNVVSVYASQISLTYDFKRQFGRTWMRLFKMYPRGKIAFMGATLIGISEQK